MTYFRNCNTINEVKALYRKLAMENHPDKGGDLQTMQKINAEYAYAVAYIAKNGDRSTGQKYTEAEAEAEILNAKQYREAMEAIINLSGIEIELCGGWIWVSGNTYQYRAIFKANGFYFASKKIMWYFRAPEYATANKSKQFSIEEIRTKYGSQKIISTYTPRKVLN